MEDVSVGAVTGSGFRELQAAGFAALVVAAMLRNQISDGRWRKRNRD
jgi:hypothetical protein